ncbi:class I glutamine amidotransferase-like protein [Lentithecium fluviatile CBS 122367]|uniref:Class I glutamine amidotransferase-like protein n=1 Tax=Lentithecium fluviatile CBS 122367 TaxID=1168545 RepID=A0A6G1IQD9_9PLEO|nr:class I glutamine amidotransferase-like protein [Lentithecium fluviatile CBS 122367]
MPPGSLWHFGFGNIALEQANNTAIEEFLVARYDRVKYLLSVCTGAISLARAGLPKGKKATTNKAMWAWTTDPAHGEGIEWVPSARWVEDGKIWTSSGVAAGMDMMYAFLRHVYGTEELDGVMNGIEYAPHVDPSWDPFSVVHKKEPKASTPRTQPYPSHSPILIAIFDASSKSELSMESKLGFLPETKGIIVPGEIGGEAEPSASELTKEY